MQRRMADDLPPTTQALSSHANTSMTRARQQTQTGHDRGGGAERRAKADDASISYVKAEKWSGP